MDNIPPVLAAGPIEGPPSPTHSGATQPQSHRADDNPDARDNAALLSAENIEEIGWEFPTSAPDPSSRFECHDIEVRVLSHTDDGSGVLNFADVPLNTDASQLKRMIGGSLNEDHTPPAYLLFMGRRVHDAAIVRDIVRHVVCSASSAWYWR
jgi:hypothetical protein